MKTDISKEFSNLNLTEVIMVSELQEHIFNLTQSSLSSTVQYVSKSIFADSKERISQLVSNIFNAIKIRPSSTSLYANFTKQLLTLASPKNEFDYIRLIILEPFPSISFPSFDRLAFLNECLKYEIITEKQIFLAIQFNYQKYPHTYFPWRYSLVWFMPLILRNDPKLFQDMFLELKNCIGSIQNTHPIKNENNSSSAKNNNIIQSAEIIDNNQSESSIHPNLHSTSYESVNHPLNKENEAPTPQIENKQANIDNNHSNIPVMPIPNSIPHVSSNTNQNHNIYKKETTLPDSSALFNIDTKSNKIRKNISLCKTKFYSILNSTTETYRKSNDEQNVGEIFNNPNRELGDFVESIQYLKSNNWDLYNKMVSNTYVPNSLPAILKEDRVQDLIKLIDKYNENERKKIKKIEIENETSDDYVYDYEEEEEEEEEKNDDQKKRKKILKKVSDGDNYEYESSSTENESPVSSSRNLDSNADDKNDPETYSIRFQETSGKFHSLKNSFRENQNKQEETNKEDNSFQNKETNNLTLNEINNEENKSTQNQEEIKPTQNQEEIKPTQNQEEIKPTQNQEEIKPTQNQEEIKPTQNQEEIKSTQNQEEIKPTQNQEEIKSTQNQEEIKPTQNQEEIKPTQNQEENKSTQNQEENKSTQNQEEIKPVDNAEIKPVDNAEIKPVDNAEIKPVDNAEIKPVDNAEIKPVDNAEIKPVDNAEIKPVDNAEIKPVDNAEIKPVENQEEFKPTEVQIQNNTESNISLNKHLNTTIESTETRSEMTTTQSMSDSIKRRKTKRPRRTQEVPEFVGFNLNQRIISTVFEKNNFLRNGPTLVQFACFYGSVLCVIELIKRGADVLLPDLSNKRTSMFAVAGGNMKIIEILEFQQDDFTATPQVAAFFVRQEAFDRLMMTKRFSIDNVDDRYASILHQAAASNNIRVMIYCIERNIDINIRNNKNMTPLHMAVLNGHIDATLLLASHNKININAKSVDDVTPLIIAAKNGYVKIATILLNNPGIDVNLADNKHSTALHFAAFYNNMELVKLLVENKDINLAIKDGNGRNAAELASACGYEECAKFIAEHMKSDCSIA